METIQIVLDLIQKMPNDASLGQIIRWVNLLDVLGIGAKEQNEHFQGIHAEIDRDLEAYFSKSENRGQQCRGSLGNAKEKVLNLVRRLPRDAAIADILNRLALLKKIEIALDESEHGLGMDHDDFFEQLAQEDAEESKTAVAAPRSKRPSRTKEPDRASRPQDRRKIRPAS